ncbi:site-2 protease family protein [Halorarius halobius]|uniref:site-2 protease family protein n=1 Tax=Halorarius halobius TaxID=2962671 RepID=UPI0020CF5445|nr:site-2 protease family protein [Halorarius halobius]
MSDDFGPARSADASRSEFPGDAPDPAAVADVFHVEELRRDGDRLLYLGEPRVGPDALERRLWPLFREAGYDIRFASVTDEETDPISGVDLTRQRHALVASPTNVGVDGIPWVNIVTLVLTVLTTLAAGNMWFYETTSMSAWDPVNLVTGQNWKFTVALLAVLGVHELGHYTLSRYHEVDATLPYFIPIPNIIGTFGALIRMKGRIPDRKALFDIGVAGPLAGLVMAVVVSVVGLYMDPVSVPSSVLESPSAFEIKFGYPPLLQGLSWATGQPLTYQDPTVAVNPVVFGGWVGMFVTFLNLIPVGQLDGGHLVRAMLGERQETVAALVPAGLFALASYLYLFGNVGMNAPLLWGFWGLVALGLAYAGPVDPIFEEGLDRKRMAVGLLTFALGLLCFTPVPFELVQ